MRFWQNVLRLAPVGPQAPLKSSEAPDFQFSRHWSVLGPFQIGTREAAWGADPLEYYGGFRSLLHDNSTFRSSLVPNGTVAWSSATAELRSLQTTKHEVESSAELHIDFPGVDWTLQRQSLGWAAVQWQGWARGEIIVSFSDQVVDLYVERVLEFWVDGKHYFGGDFFGFGRSPVTLHLVPGRHIIDVRLIRDVRSMGGTGNPELAVKLTLRTAANGLSVISYTSTGSPPRQIVLPDVVSASYIRLASSYASFTVHNSASRSIHIVDVLSALPGCTTKLALPKSTELVPGQTRPVAFKIHCPDAVSETNVQIDVVWKFGNEDQNRTLTVNTKTVLRSIGEPQKITFMHPGGVVSYAILRPPPLNISSCSGTLPILISLHGAGVEAEDDLIRHSFDSLPDLCTWLLFPTGGTPWSGDDWHQWGFADVEAAVAAIPDWINNMGWTGSGVDTDRWLIVGHSNGGQGTWYAATHRPDKVIAAAELSGYSSIQNYVPYSLWHAVDPARFAISQASLNTYNHPLLVENLAGMPIMQQHGAIDDNVPAFHSRLMGQLMAEHDSSSIYNEFPGKNHYWNGVMTTTPLAEFYKSALATTRQPRNLANFSVASANPGDTGPKNGVQILELNTPGHVGRLDVSFDQFSLHCALRTRNVRSFRVDRLYDACKLLQIDGYAVTTATISGQFYHSQGNWQQASTSKLPHLPPRLGKQLGALDAILHTTGTFQIVVHSRDASPVALQISRNLCQYYGADTEITNDYAEAAISEANIISVAVGNDLPKGIRGYPHAIRIVNGHLEVTDTNGQLRRWDQPIAAVFLRPLLPQRLELAVWASDAESLDLAARLVPMMTGTGTPDFVVMDQSMRWKGLEGTLALGFLDADWSMSINSFVD